MIEIRCVGFRMEDIEEVEETVAEALDALGMKAAGFVVFDNLHTRRCLDGLPYPHVVVCSDDQKQLDKVALQINLAFGVMVKKELCQEFLLPIPVENWINRGR